MSIIHRLQEDDQFNLNIPTPDSQSANCDVPPIVPVALAEYPPDEEETIDYDLIRWGSDGGANLD